MRSRRDLLLVWFEMFQDVLDLCNIQARKHMLRFCVVVFCRLEEGFAVVVVVVMRTNPGNILADNVLVHQK